jgi:hypothetical protein
MATVGSMGSDPEQQIAVLQSQVRERLAQLRPIRPGSESYTVAADAVIKAAGELIDYEERLPLLLDQAPRRMSLLIVRWSGLAPAAVGLSLLIGAVVGWLPHWWLPTVVALFGAAVQLLRMPVPAPCEPHVGLRPGAVLVAAGALVIGIGAAVRLPVWIAGLGLVLLLVGVWQVRGNQLRDDPSATPSRRPVGRAQGRW